MKKDFDFDDIGKRTPYYMPDGFFEEMQQKVMTQVAAKKQRRYMRLVIATIATAAVLAGIFFIPSWYQTSTAQHSGTDILAVETHHDTAEPIDKWIRDLSDEELEELVNFSEYDIFLN